MTSSVLAPTTLRTRLRAIILEERTDAGQTVIEKFEHEASSVGAAIVLLTPDDVGGKDEVEGPVDGQGQEGGEGGAGVEDPVPLVVEADGDQRAEARSITHGNRDA